MNVFPKSDGQAGESGVICEQVVGVSFHIPVFHSQLRTELIPKAASPFFCDHLSPHCQ